MVVVLVVRVVRRVLSRALCESRRVMGINKSEVFIGVEKRGKVIWIEEGITF